MLEFHKYPIAPTADIYPGGSLHPYRASRDGVRTLIEIPEFCSNESTPSQFEAAHIIYDSISDEYRIKFIDVTTKQPTTELVYSRDGELIRLILILPNLFHHHLLDPSSHLQQSPEKLTHKMRKINKETIIIVSPLAHLAHYERWTNNKMDYKFALKWSPDLTVYGDIPTARGFDIKIVMELDENEHNLQLFVGSTDFGKAIPVCTLVNDFASVFRTDHISAYELLNRISLSKHGSLPKRTKE